MYYIELKDGRIYELGVCEYDLAQSAARSLEAQGLIEPPYTIKRED